MLSDVIRFTNQVNVPGPTPGSSLFNLDIPFIAGAFSHGALATVSFLLSFVFTILMIVWVGYSIYAAIRIMNGGNNPDEMEKGFNTIKNVWIGITFGLVFFGLLSLAGSVFGFGSVYDWGTRLAQCGGYQGEFYFRKIPDQLEVLKKEGVAYGNGKVYCCKWNDGFTPFPPYDRYDLNVDQFNWLVSPDGNTPSGPAFTECKKEFDRILE